MKKVLLRTCDMLRRLRPHIVSQHPVEVFPSCSKTGSKARHLELYLVILFHIPQADIAGLGKTCELFLSSPLSLSLSRGRPAFRGRPASTRLLDPSPKPTRGRTSLNVRTARLRPWSGVRPLNIELLLYLLGRPILFEIDGRHLFASIVDTAQANSLLPVGSVCIGLKNDGHPHGAVA